jgi:hypothetical protein
MKRVIVLPSAVDTAQLRTLCERALEADDDDEARALARADLFAVLSTETLLALVQRWEDVETFWMYVKKAPLGR